MTGDDELALLILPGPVYELGIEADAVGEIVPARAWQGTSPLVLPGFSEGDGEDARIVVIHRSDGGRLPLRVGGRLRTQRFSRRAAMTLPSMIAPYARWVSAVLIPDGAPPVVIVDRDRLG